MATPKPTPEQEALRSVWDSVIDIAKAQGAIPLNQHEGLWILETGKWKLSVNAHPKEIGDVPPFQMFVEYNGWPYGLLRPLDGEIIHGADQNIFTLAEALKARAATMSGEG